MKTFQRDLSRYNTVLDTPDPRPLVLTPSDHGEHHQVQTGSRNCTQTGSTINLATETDIDAISMAIPILGIQFFTSHILDPSPIILRWRTNTGSSYNFATENDVNVISSQTASKNRHQPEVIITS